MIKSQKSVISLIVICLLFCSVSLQAASFEKYAQKLLRFEGVGFGIDKPTWGNKDFTKAQALKIHKEQFWNRYHGNLFESQALAEVFIDHLINAGEGKNSANIKAFEAIVGAKQDGILSADDIKKANNFIFPEQVVNIYVKYRILYYKSRKSTEYHNGWIKRAMSFFIYSNAGNPLEFDEMGMPEELENMCKAYALMS